MPTPRLRTVGPSSGSFHYTSISAAIAGEVTAGADLVASDEILDIEVHAGDYTSDGGGVNFTPDVNGVTINGFTTDGTRYVYLHPASGAKHNGALRSGADYSGITVRCTNVAAPALRNQDAVALVQGMAFHQAAGTLHSVQFALHTSTGNAALFSLNNIWASDTVAVASPTNGGGIYNHIGIVVSVNDFVYHPEALPDSGGYGVLSLKAGTAYSLFYNTTIRNFRHNCYVYAGTSNDYVKLRNVVATGGVVYDFAGGQIHTVWHTCAVGDAQVNTLGGTVTNHQANATVTFAAADSTEITSGATSAVDLGADLSADPDYPFAFDIILTARPQGSDWDRGAWELAAAAEILLSGSATASATVASSLATEITLSAGATASAAGAAALETAIEFSAAATCSATVAASLSTEIPLSAAATAQATGAAGLTTEITLSGSATATATAAGALDQGETLLSATATATATGAAALATEITLAGSATAEATVAASLETEILFAGAASAQAVGAANLETAISLVGSADVLATVAAELTTEILFSGAGVAQATTTANLAAGVGLGVVLNPSAVAVTARRGFASLTPDRRVFAL